MVSPAPQANTRATASPGPGEGSGTVSSTNGVPGAFSSIAFIANLHVGSESYTSNSTVPGESQPPTAWTRVYSWHPQDYGCTNAAIPREGKKSLTESADAQESLSTLCGRML